MLHLLVVEEYQTLGAELAINRGVRALGIGLQAAGAEAVAIFLAKRNSRALRVLAAGAVGGHGDFLSWA